MNNNRVVATVLPASFSPAGDLKKRVTHCIVWLALLLLFLVVAGCRQAPPTVIPSPTTAALAQLAPTPTATATLAPSSTAPPTDTPPATSTLAPTATVTPLPVATIAIPLAWEATVQAALEQVTAGWQWQLLVVEDPAQALATGQADMALLPDAEGTPAGQRPLAIAVPFTTAWEEISPTQASEIVENGHGLAQIMPWDNLTPSSKALRVGGLHPLDKDYPLQQPWSLHSTAGYEDAAALLAQSLQEVEANRQVHLLAVGDVMLDRALGRAIHNGRLDYPFAQVSPLIATADIAVANVESSLGDVGTPAEKAYTFQAPPEAAQSLAGAGFDLVTLANNHALDYGPEALLQGISLLEAQGIETVGAGTNAEAAHAPVFLTENGLRLAFLGYVHVPQEGVPPYFDTATWTATATEPGMAWAVPEQIRADVAAAREQADVVIVQLHSGYEYVDPPSPEQMAAAQAAVDAGAALVLGHHAHILQGVQFYKDGVIVYGLGNFAFTIDGPPETALLNVWLDPEGVRSLEFIPAVIQEGGQPRPATTEEAAAIRQRIYVLSAGLP